MCLGQHYDGVWNFKLPFSVGTHIVHMYYYYYVQD